MLELKNNVILFLDNQIKKRIEEQKKWN